MKLTNQRKENEDLKYDNTLLYEKNVQKDEKLLQKDEENCSLREELDQEVSKRKLAEKDAERKQE